jgi:hypothetical protein
MSVRAETNICEELRSKLDVLCQKVVETNPRLRELQERGRKARPVREIEEMMKATESEDDKETNHPAQSSIITYTLLRGNLRRKCYRGKFPGLREPQRALAD